jgi:hypothetical protein
MAKMERFGVRINVSCARRSVGSVRFAISYDDGGAMELGRRCGCWTACAQRSGASKQPAPPAATDILEPRSSYSARPQRATI